MNINRHNYEEYFILYMDNELDAEGRRAVEAFLQQHPDLKEELDTLLHYKMSPDTSIVYAGKEELLKENGHAVISTGNYEEWLTLYVDEELNAEQKILVERYIAANPAAQKDLAFFQQVKLQPEEIVLADKSSLYRKEEKAHPIIGWRAAAAAILLLAFGLSAVLIVSKRSGNGKEGDVVDKIIPAKQEEIPLKTNEPTPAEQNNTAVALEEKNSPVTNPVVAGNNSVTENKKNKIAPPENKTNEQYLVNKRNIVEPKNKFPEVKNPGNRKEEELIADNNKPSNNLPLPLNNPNASNKTENLTASNNPEKTKRNDIPSTQDVTIKPAPPSDYIQASNTSTEELEQSEGKKNKNRGLFRKIARTFEKRTNIDPTDDNKLLVAGLSIKLK